jgi:hypothetical protein
MSSSARWPPTKDGSWKGSTSSAGSDFCECRDTTTGWLWAKAPTVVAKVRRSSLTRCVGCGVTIAPSDHEAAMIAPRSDRRRAAQPLAQPDRSRLAVPGFCNRLLSASVNGRYGSEAVIGDRRFRVPGLKIASSIRSIAGPGDTRLRWADG